MPAPRRSSAATRHGRPQVRAIRREAPLRVDGQLDEAVYRDVPAISDFIQTLPRETQSRPNVLKPE
jgi:hypothetical protein